MDKYLTIAVIGNGEIRDYEKIFNKIKHYQLVIAADGGANHCLKMGIQPKVIIGDFDSIEEDAIEHFKGIAKLSFPRDKDETDLELAINHAFSLGSKKIALFATAGNRLDHTLANLHLLRRYPAKLFMETENETIFLISKDFPLSMDGVFGKTVSLLPFTEKAKGVKTQGFKWELETQDLNYHFLSISNECVKDSIYVSLEEGELFFFLN